MLMLQLNKNGKSSSLLKDKFVALTSKGDDHDE